MGGQTKGRMKKQQRNEKRVNKCSIFGFQRIRGLSQE